MADTKVFVLVDTDHIANDSSDKKVNSVIFFDNRGDRPGSGKDFDAKIDKAKKITWKGRVMKNFMDKEDLVGDSVDVIKVEYVAGPHLLIDDVYEDDKSVVGYVKEEDQEGVEDYKITIRVNKGSTYEEYCIDPKMHT